MGYTKQNFMDGKTLTAAQLNHMEAGIAAAWDMAGSGTGGSAVMGIPGAAGDGETDDTEALTAALSQSNCVVDGGNKKYKYIEIIVNNVKNLEVRNVIFWKGANMVLEGCKNIRFVNCTWEGVNPNGVNKIWTCGIRLRGRTENGENIWCEDIHFEGCTFKDIWYNENLQGSYSHHISGIGIVPQSVHRLFVNNCFFTQIKGNAAIHWNTYDKSGYFEITNNLFYLTCFGSVCLFAFQAEFPKMRCKVSGNQFIGSGLGYLPPEYLAGMPEHERGVGCAALLGGNGADVAPRKQHAICENNVFIDCCESSIEGPAWNPCIGNSCYGQGTLQDEENCRLMEEKYKLDYKLQVRYNPSVNFIYRYCTEEDYDPDDPMVFSDNVMGRSYVDRDGFIALPGVYASPVVFTNNTLDTPGTTKLQTHILFAQFLNGFRFENNHGIYPYFNQCLVKGDFIIDEFLSQWQSNFDNANLITNRSRDRFPETRFSFFDPSSATLDNGQAVLDGGYALLTAKDLEESSGDAAQDVPVYDITQDARYDTEEKAVIFDGTFGIDTGIKLFADKKDFTIIAKFRVDSYSEEGMLNFSFIPVLSTMNYTEGKSDPPGFDIGLSLQNGEREDTIATGGFINIRNCWKISSSVSIDANNYFGYSNTDYSVLIVRKNGVLAVYDWYMQSYVKLEGEIANTIFDGTLRLGENMAVPTIGGDHKLKGKIYDCRVYDHAISTKRLEEMFPNIYSNESRTKGTVTCFVPNRLYKYREVRCAYVEVTLDLGEYAWAKYKGVYPQAVGVKVYGIYGFDDVIWVGTGTDGHVKKWIYKGANLTPHQGITVAVVNTGLCPGLKAKLLGFRCVLMTQDYPCTEATDFDVVWEVESRTITVGETLKGTVNYVPWSTNVRKDIAASIAGNAASLNVSGDVLLVTGVNAGTAELTVMLKSGQSKTYTITVKEAEKTT